MNTKRSPMISPAMVVALMLAQSSGATPPKGLSEGQRLPRPEPWHKIQLSKSERRGKTPEEVQALRKAKWEAQCRGR